MALDQVRFDVFEQEDLRDFNGFLSNPKIVIEKQKLQFVSEPVYEDGSIVEYEERLMLTVLFSKYEEDTNMNNLFKKAILKIVPEYDSNGYESYQRFIKSEFVEVIDEQTAYNGKTAMKLITFFDKHFDINEEFDISQAEAKAKGISFDSDSGQFLIE